MYFTSRQWSIQLGKLSISLMKATAAPSEPCMRVRIFSSLRLESSAWRKKTLIPSFSLRSFQGCWAIKAPAENNCTIRNKIETRFTFSGICTKIIGKPKSQNASCVKLSVVYCFFSKSRISASRSSAVGPAGAGAAASCSFLSLFIPFTTMNRAMATMSSAITALMNNP